MRSRAFAERDRQDEMRALFGFEQKPVDFVRTLEVRRIHETPSQDQSPQDAPEIERPADSRSKDGQGDPAHRA